MTDIAPTAAGIVIVGAGGHGRELLDLLEAAGLAEQFVGFVDDATPVGEAADRLDRRGATIVGSIAWLASSTLDYVVGIGNGAARRSVVARLGEAAGTALTMVHPSASIGSDNRFEHGVVIAAGAVVTTNVTIGRHSHLNVGCAVQHDSVIGDFVTLSPGVFVNGDVTIGDDVFLGTGAVVTRGCQVGAGAVIGAGAVVLDDVEPGSRRFGVPGRAAGA